MRPDIVFYTRPDGEVSLVVVYMQRKNCTEEGLEIFTDYLNQNVLKDKIVLKW